MKRTSECTRRTLRSLLGACLLLLIPAFTAEASCESTFCPAGPDYCPTALLEKIQICKAIAEVEKGINAANREVERIAGEAKDVENQFLAIDESLDAVIGEMETVTQSALVFDQLRKTHDALADGTLEITTNLVHAVEEAHAVAQFHLELTSARYNAFAGSTGCGLVCQQFRQELIDVFTNLETATNLAFDTMIAQLPADLRAQLTMSPRLDLSPIRIVIEHLPGLVLFPLHEAFTAIGSADLGATSFASPPVMKQTSSLTGTLNGFLQDIIANLTIARDNSIDFVNDGGLSLCVQLNGMDPKASSDVVLAMAIMSASSKLVFAASDVLESAGFTGIDSVNQGVAAGVLIKTGFKLRWVRVAGKALKSIATAAALVADTTLRRFSRCRDQLDQQVMLCVIHNNKQKSFGACRSDVANGARFGF